MTEPPTIELRRLGAKTRMARDWALRATESRVFGAFIWALLLALAALTLWLSPPDLVAWRSSFDKAIKTTTDVVNLLSKHPVVVFALDFLQHPLAAVASILLLFLVWLKDQRANLASRSTVPFKGAPSPAYRVHLFAHRLGLVVVGLLAIFPGVPLLFSGWGIILLPIILVVPYVAIRIVAWVVAALFE